MNKVGVIVGYIIAFIAIASLSFFLATKAAAYFQKSYLQESQSLTSAVSGSGAEENTKQPLQNQASLDFYAKHIVSINDPTQGCGCAACCAAI